MNYLKEVLAFGELAQISGITNNEFRLWHELMSAANKFGWRKTFCVPNSVLAVNASMSEKTLQNSRNRLVERGLIKYYNRGNGKAPKYEMISVADGKTTSQQFTDVVSDVEADNNTTYPRITDVVSDVLSDVVSDVLSEPFTDVLSTLNKQNKTNNKQNKISVSNLSVNNKSVDKGGSRGEKGTQEVEPIATEPAQHAPPEKEPPKKSKRFVKPSIDEIKAYIVELGGCNFTAEYFFDHYEANGWTAGRNPMKDWRATVRNWKRRDTSKPSYPSRASPQQGGYNRSNDLVKTEAEYDLDDEYCIRLIPPNKAASGG